MISLAKSNISRRGFLKLGASAAAVAVVAGVGGFLGFQQATPTPTQPEVGSKPQILSVSLSVQDKVTPWAFVVEGVMGGTDHNPLIRVRKADTIEITLINNGQLEHAWTLDADSPSPYDVSTGIIEIGASETVRFVSDQPGTFTYYCSVPGHRDLGMHGTLIVTE